jgi:hypothetical protein
MTSRLSVRSAEFPGTGEYNRRYVELNITPIMLSSQLCDVQPLSPYEHCGFVLPNVT